MPITREGIEPALKKVRPDIAELIPDRQMTRIEPVPCPGLSRYTILSITHLSPYKPLLHYIGYQEGAEAIILSQDPEAFNAMAAADGAVSIASTKDAAGYAEAFLTVTRSLSKATYLVKSAADLKWMPKPEPADVIKREEFDKEGGKVIAAPKAEAKGSGFEVTAYQVVEQEVQRATVQVAKDGKVKAEFDPVAAGLPLVAGH